MSMQVAGVGMADQPCPIGKHGSIGGDATGAGSLAPLMPVPAPGRQLGLSAMMDSIARLIPPIRGDVAEIVLAEVAAKMKDIEGQAQVERYKNDQEAKRAALQEKQARLKEAEEKIQKAIDARQSASIWDKIKLAFQFIGAALSIALGAVVAAGCPVLGGLMIASGVVGIVMAIDAAVQTGTGMGMVGHIVKAAGGSDEQCAEADMGFRIGLAVIGAALAIAGFGYSLTSAASLGLAALGMVASNLRNIGTATNLTVTIATAVGDSVATGIRMDASASDAESRKLRAQAKDLEALLQILDQFIEMTLKLVVESADRLNAMLDSIVEMAKDKNKSLSHARFTV